MAEKRKYKLDVFRVLNNTDKKNMLFFDKLTDEEKKAYYPLIITRWLSGTRDIKQIVFLNELVNKFVFALLNHKSLLYKLMTICTSGKVKKYYWNKTLSKRLTSTPNTASVISEYFSYNLSKTADALPLLSNEDILSCAEQLGRQKEEITKIKRELKTR